MSEPTRYRLEFSREAEKAIDRLDKSYKRRIRLALDELANNPRPHGYLKMSGYTDRYRIRIGDWRVVYKIVDEVLVVLIIKVANRSDVYK